MTDDQLNAIRARHAAAAKGPWRSQLGVVFDATREHICAMPARREAETAFIAATWADVRDLLAEVERLRKPPDIDSDELKATLDYLCGTRYGVSHGEMRSFARTCYETGRRDEATEIHDREARAEAEVERLKAENATLREAIDAADDVMGLDGEKYPKEVAAAQLKIDDTMRAAEAAKARKE